MPTSLLAGQGVLAHAWPRISAATCLLGARSPGRAVHGVYYTAKPAPTMLPQRRPACNDHKFPSITITFVCEHLSMESPTESEANAELHRDMVISEILLSEIWHERCTRAVCRKSLRSEGVKLCVCVSLHTGAFLPRGIISQWLLFPGLYSILHMI